MKKRMIYGLVTLAFGLTILTLASCPNPAGDDGDSGPTDYSLIDGWVYENSTLEIFDYGNLLMNSEAVNDNVDIDLALDTTTIDPLSTQGLAMMADFSTSLDSNGNAVWNGVTFNVDTANFRPVDLSQYGAMVFKARLDSSAYPDAVIEKVGFALGSQYEVYALDSITATAANVWDTFIIPIPDSSKLTAVSNLLFFTDSAAKPNKVYIDDVQFIPKNDFTIDGMGGPDLNTYNNAISVAVAVAPSATYNLNDNQPYWINYRSPDDPDGTYKNTNNTNVYSVNGNLAGYFTWASDNDSIATVDEFGVITGVADGTANITSEFGGYTFTYAVTVAAPINFSDGLIYKDELKHDFVAKTLNNVAGEVPSDTANTTSVAEGTSSTFVDLSASTEWGGGFFKQAAGVDASGFTNFIFSLDKSSFDSTVDYMELKFEDTAGSAASLNLFDYTPTVNGNWETYTIPLTDFGNVDTTKFAAFGLWNPKVGGAYTKGNFYLDNIYFE